MKRVIGIGNALVDIMVRIPDETLLGEFSLPKGSMQLVDSEKSEEVKSGTQHLEWSVSSGGSVANTIHTLGMLGASPGYIGSVGMDETEAFFNKDMLGAGVMPILFSRESPTGTAVALVTPDSERTFATHLGAAVDLDAAEITADLLKGYDILYVEGYLIANPGLVTRVCQVAKSLGMEIALDLSSYNVVEAYREDFRNIVGSYVDILFANEEEAKAYTGLDAEAALELISDQCAVAIVKTGSKGSMIKRGEETVKVGVIPVIPLDSTGAGDMYAAGFLYGYANDEPLDKCGVYGAILAGSVLEYMGSKLPPYKWPEIKSKLGFTNPDATEEEADMAL